MNTGTRQDQRFNFNLGGHKIDICTDFKYLDVIFSRNRHFHQKKKHNVEQARKAMHVLFKRIRNLDIPIDLQLNLSYDVASGSEITPCNKICKPLVVYRFTGNVMTSITTLRK